jgi:hypothetical protein
MIPFSIFIGICSSGLLFMVYFLVGFWRDGRRQPQSTQRPALRIPSGQIPVATRRRIPDVSLENTAREVLIDEPEHELRTRSVWQVIVNPTKMQARRVR